MWSYNYSDTLYHYGTKGMKWGVRHWQYADGTYTPAGVKRYFGTTSRSPTQKRVSQASTKVKNAVNTGRTHVTGKQYVDTYLKKGTTFSRIQTSKDFEKYAFYATYKKKDVDKYMGLFGKNLTTRANAEAKRAEKQAKKSKDDYDWMNAKALREKADNTKVYQLKIETTKKLKVPSDENAGHITANLLKEKDFRNNLTDSINHSKEIMKRPTQQVLFKQAQNALKKDPTQLTSSERTAIYKAFNLSLTNHNPYEIAAQDRFYKEMRKKGYDALLDYNDQQYSSYHAKRPMIVFNTDAVTLKSVSQTNPKVVDQLYRKYNRERIRKEITANTIGYVTKSGSKTLSECSAYVKRHRDNYLR